jgi:Carbohydrate binding domain
VAFAQSWYPNMRFGLGVALMNDGYFIHDFGDTTPPVTWSYDEYDFDLGTPVAPATPPGSEPGANQILNGGFTGQLPPWRLSVNNDGSASGTAAVDGTGGADGGPTALISVTSPGTAAWHIDLQEGNVSLKAGQEYVIQFQSRASSLLTFQLSMQGGTSPYPYCGLTGTNLTVGTSWAPYSVSFIAPATASDGILEFRAGGQVAIFGSTMCSFSQHPPAFTSATSPKVWCC